jgi:hypothetical protein
MRTRPRLTEFMQCGTPSWRSLRTRKPRYAKMTPSKRIARQVLIVRQPQRTNENRAEKPPISRLFWPVADGN